MLEQGLREALAGLGELRQLLQQEYAALRSRDLAALERIVGEKQAQVERLNQIDVLRAEVLRAQGFSADRRGLQAYVDAAPSDAARAALQQLLGELERTAAQVSDQNEINGAVVTASHDHISKLLTLLSGRDPQQTDFLYDQDSRKVFSSSGQPLAKV